MEHSPQSFKVFSTYENGNCWNVITPNGRWVYVDNSATSSVAGLAVAANGSLTPVATTAVSTLGQGTTNLHITVGGDGKYLFTLDSGSGAVSVFSMNSDGTVNPLGDIEALPKTEGSNGIAVL